MPIDQLAADLTALVDRLEADRNERRILSWDEADRLHELRQRAERLFGDMGAAR